MTEYWIVDLGILGITFADFNMVWLFDCDRDLALGDAFIGVLRVVTGMAYWNFVKTIYIM